MKQISHEPAYIYNELRWMCLMAHFFVPAKAFISAAMKAHIMSGGVRNEHYKRRRKQVIYETSATH